MIHLLCAFDREKYIPITRRTLIRRIIEERDLLTPLEQRKFDEFAVALDSAIVQEYHGVLNDLKVGLQSGTKRGQIWKESLMYPSYPSSYT